MKAKEVIRLVEADGWYEVRHTGSHKMFRHDVKPGLVIVPVHGARDLHKGLERKILKSAGLE